MNATPAPRLLVIDDNPSIHRDFDLVLRDELQNEELEEEERRLYGDPSSAAIPKPEYIIDHALSGLDGLDQVKQSVAVDRPYQVAFVDIRMPGIDGVETIERIWKLDNRVQIVICTAFADYSWDDLARRLGLTDNLLVLKKPFDAIEVTQMASTLSRKWFLARLASLKHEQMELLVARRTERLLTLLPQTAGSSVTQDSPHDGHAEKDLTVILVTGHPLLAEKVRHAVKSEARVLHTADPEEGWRQALELMPDVVVTATGGHDQVDGMSFCRRLKQDDLTGHIPVLILTSGELRPGRMASPSCEADDFLAEGSSSSDLRGRISRLLGRINPMPRTTAPGTAGNRGDTAFLGRATEIVEKHLPDYEFDVDALARQLAVSRRQLFRKFKAVTGSTPNHLIRALRLKRAAQLLRTSNMTVTEVTYAVGFADLKHFREVFKEQYGVLPGEYAGTRTGVSLAQ